MTNRNVVANASTTTTRKRFLPMLVMLLSVLLGTVVRVCDGAPSEDRVDSLPLYGTPPTAQYSGYVDATEGCDTSVNGEYCKLHYWFTAADAENEAGGGDDDTIANDRPVVLWLNGGPGVSGVSGYLEFIGPIMMTADGGLMDNPYSWTRFSNILIVEIPLGVGYSYCANQVAGEVCRNSDRYTATALSAGLIDFFATKFPELRDNDFFVAGESYAGVYIPTLANEIIKHNEIAAHKNSTINLRGVAVGDPCTDSNIQRQSREAVWYGYKNGIIDDETYGILKDECDIDIPTGLYAQVHRHDSRKRRFLEFRSAMASATVRAKPSRAAQPADNKAESIATNTVDSGATERCVLAYRKFLFSSSKGIAYSWEQQFINYYSLFGPVTDDEKEQVNAYMSRDDVREALHVQETPYLTTWQYPDMGFSYAKEFDACNDKLVYLIDIDDDSKPPSMIPFYRHIVPKLDRTWIYNGDTDPCISYEGTRLAVEAIGFPVAPGGGYRPWFYDHDSADVEVLRNKAILYGPDLSVAPYGVQFGGEIKDYEGGLAFLTIHGAGHMVPQFRPQAALQMMTKFVQFEELSPPMPVDEALVDTCPDCFTTMLDDWTTKARSEAYSSLYSSSSSSSASSSRAGRMASAKGKSSGSKSSSSSTGTTSSTTSSGISARRQVSEGTLLIMALSTTALILCFAS